MTLGSVKLTIKAKQDTRCVWMLKPQLAELFLGGGGELGGVILLEAVYHWGWVWRFQKAHTNPSQLSLSLSFWIKM